MVNKASLEVVNAEIQGRNDALLDRAFPCDLPEHLYSAYMTGRGIGVQSRTPRQERQPLFSSQWCVEVLAKQGPAAPVTGE